MALIKLCFSLLAIIVFCAQNASASTSDLNNAGCGFNDMAAFYQTELGIGPVEIQYIFKRMKNPNTNGYARKQGKHKYLIALANGLEPSETRVTMAHEMVHIRQMEEGSINKAEFEKHYMNRSFEDEAFRLSLPMAAKFYTEHRCPDEPL
ncbi:MAG: hypothetical protein ACR2PT_19600 [Endozoicomonas sp.]